MELTQKRNEMTSLGDEPKTKRPRKLWKRILKWSLLAVIVLAVAWGLFSYWTSTNDCARYALTPANPMKGIVYCDYGVSNLKLQDIEKPTPADDQLLVRVHAVSVNPLDWHFIEGTPYIGRFLFGMGARKPKDTRPGVDFAGTVEAVGKNVTKYKPGDEVFGGRSGAFGQYVCVRESRAVALKPANITFEQAASVPIAAITALQAVRDKGHVQAGQKVLINGASGGVGTFAVQLAKSYGADVTGVCSTRNLDLVRSIGADHVIDYTKEDFSNKGQRYDLILDNVGTQPLSQFRRALEPKGQCVMIGGGGPNDGRLIGPLARPIKAMLMSPFVNQKFGMMFAQLNHDDLAFLGELMQSGKIKPVIDRTYKLSDLPDAIRYLEQGHARGKVVLTVD
jgi:NADPH:quinone reductase-like Zn-dependent oxidoreductase